MVNTLSKLWWLGKKTYIDNEENPYIMLDYISHDINGYAFTFFGSNWSNSEKTLRVFFDAIFEYDQSTGEKVGRALFNEVMKYANCLSGIYILDACDDAFIKEKFIDFLYARSAELKQEAEFNKVNNVRTTGVEKMDNLIKAVNLIGGHGKYKEIVTAYETITQIKASRATKDYISAALEKNCPDRRKYSGRPIFYCITVGKDHIWKIANEYLVRENMRIRKKLMEDQISMLSSNERPIFNLITAINGNKFKLEDLYQFSGQMAEVLPSDQDIKLLMKGAVSSMREKGLLELVDNDIIKKAYSIKIN